MLLSDKDTPLQWRSPVQGFPHIIIIGDGGRAVILLCRIWSPAFKLLRSWQEIRPISRVALCPWEALLVHVSLPPPQCALWQLGVGCHSCWWVMRGHLWVQHEGLLQQLQSDAAGGVPSQPPIPTCSLLPQKQPWHSRMVATWQVTLQLLVLPDLLQQPHKQNAEGSAGRTESWGGGERDHFFW